MSFIPYHKQLTDESCGVAVAQMVLEYYGTIVSQEQLMRELPVTENGTSKTALRRLFMKYGVHFKEYAAIAAGRGKEQVLIVDSNNLSNLITHLEHGSLAILNYTTPEGDGHYVLAHSHTPTHLIVHDPDIDEGGANKLIDKAAFTARWISGNNKWVKWCMIIPARSPVINHIKPRQQHL